jgi:hypothetical protein
MNNEQCTIDTVRLIYTDYLTISNYKKTSLSTYQRYICAANTNLEKECERWIVETTI